ncbi:MAG: hypothetical protein GXO87_07580 [Chlorobi bacterium]|nr:hypothetical protein [Chlorobiota bacterium]
MKNFIDRISMKDKHKYRICPECDFFCNVKEKYKFCPKCGTQLIEKCPSCGEAIDNPFSKFCGVCGEPYRTNNKKTDLKEIK